MAETEIKVDVQSPKVDAPVAIEFQGVGIVQSIKKGIDDLVADVRSGSDEALTVLMVGVMFVVAGVYLWRRI